MRTAIARWITILLALLLIGPLLGRLAGMPRGVDGALRAAPIVSTDPVKGMAVALVAVGLAGAYSIIVARRLGVAAGMNAAGVIFGWCAWDSGTIDALLRARPEPSTLVMLAVEAFVLGLAALVIVWFIIRTASDADTLGKPRVCTPLNALGVTLAIAFGGLSVAIIAFEPLKGQSVFAAAIAAIGVGAVTQLASAGTSRFVHLMVPFAALVLLATLAPVVAMQWHGSKLIEASRAGTLLGLAAPNGFDWLCGGFLGIPVGVAWAESMMERGHLTPAAQA